MTMRGTLPVLQLVSDLEERGGVGGIGWGAVGAVRRPGEPQTKQAAVPWLPR